MNLGGLPPRECIWEDRFEAEREALDPDTASTDAQLRKVEAVLLHFPRFGLQTEEPEVWLAPIFLGFSLTGAASGTAEVDIYYSFNDRFLRFLSIRLA